MTEDADTWNRLVALLPEAEAREAGECWAVGEQEAALGVLVSGLVDHRVPIGETDRARISVLAEGWGEREFLTPRILRCRGDGEPSPVRLSEHAEGHDGGTGDVLVPWIGCDRCGRVLTRRHTRESWGGLSFVAWSYVITSGAGGSVVREFPGDAVDAAFADLLAVCAPEDAFGT
ncbi:hypothetical protein [Streptomyces sp. NPDC093105]|uniref:hypothetical protein n=1 Tax=Streptomyces sp. NPDC093105 TaxID=3366029 RepID=UPI00380092AB